MRIAMPAWPASETIWTVAPSDVVAVQPLSCSKSSSIVWAMTESLPIRAATSTSASPNLRRADVVSFIRTYPPRPTYSFSAPLMIPAM